MRPQALRLELPAGLVLLVLRHRTRAAGRGVAHQARGEGEYGCGARGGRVIAAEAREEIAEARGSHTREALARFLDGRR